MAPIIFEITCIALCLVASILMACYSCAKNDADGRIHERTLTISEYGTNTDGQKTVTLWARKAIFLPILPVRMIDTKVPAPDIHDLVKTYGPGEFKALYVKKRKGFVVTDEYLSIKEINSRYKTP